jgi:CHAT domain-containing protein/Tfp pilus assembly protein PilF
MLWRGLWIPSSLALCLVLGPGPGPGPGPLAAAGEKADAGCVGPLLARALETFQAGDLAQAEDGYRRALACRPGAPDDAQTAAALSGLGRVEMTRGDLAQAARDLERSRRLWERLEPAGLGLARTLRSLALLASDRGDQQVALGHARRSLALAERAEPGGLETATALHVLGDLEGDRGEFQLAEEHHLRGFEIEERLVPQSFRLAVALDSFCVLEMRQGKLPAARSWCNRALEMTSKIAPDSLLLSAVLNNLGDLEREEGRLELAQQYYGRALASWEARAPRSGATASMLAMLGGVELKRGLLQPARQHLERALALEQERGFSPVDQAYALLDLARLESAQHPELAASYFERSLARVEDEIERLGGSHELKAEYRARFRDTYREYVAFLIRRGHPEQAFGVLERMHGRALLAELAERDLAFAGDQPAALRRARREIAAAHDAASQELAGLDDDRSARAAELRRRLGELRQRHDDLIAEARRSSPRFATLRYPQTLDLAGAARALDAGTTLLAYGVGAGETWLFVITRQGLESVATVPLGEPELRRRVTALRQLIAEARPGGSPLERQRGRELEQAARELYAALVRPAEPWVAAAERLMILPDGPLYVLPWGALMRAPGSAAAQGAAGRDEDRYLGAWKPFHVTLSATLFAELKRGRHAAAVAANGRPALVAFGDPHVPAWARPGGPPPAGAADAALRSTVERGLALTPLPYARQEIREVARLFPGGARIYLGEEATEERAKTIGRDVRILHFATHSVVDERSPLDSAVVLSLPERLVAGRENGLLQAWEIFDGVRLDADLVVLSSCESGLGHELAGEGLIGLTRAFHYAGARSVMASLWKVSDRLTGELMVRFYRHLAAGQTKDVALQSAQREMIGRPAAAVAAVAAARGGGAGGRPVTLDAAAPYFWAAFEISGDWR